MLNKDEIVKDLKFYLSQKLEVQIKEVILFGSQSTSNASEYSDYDILIIVQQQVSKKVEESIYDLCFEIDLKYGILIDAHILSVNDLQSPRGNQPIFRNAILNGIYA